jgi:hypothetical protein
LTSGSTNEGRNMSYVVVARCVAQDEHKDEIEAVLREFVHQCRRSRATTTSWPTSPWSARASSCCTSTTAGAGLLRPPGHGALQGTSVPTILLGSPAACARGRKSAPGASTPLSLYRPRRLALRRTAGPARARGQPVRSEKCQSRRLLADMASGFPAESGHRHGRPNALPEGSRQLS